MDRLKAEAALQTLIAEQAWAQANRCVALVTLTLASCFVNQGTMQNRCPDSSIHVTFLSVCRWADATGQLRCGITLAHANVLLADWQRLMWLPGQRQHAWDDIQQLFTAQQLPPSNAAHFLISAAERLGSEGMLDLDEQVQLIKVTHYTNHLHHALRTAALTSQHAVFWYACPYRQTIGNGEWHCCVVSPFPEICLQPTMLPFSQDAACWLRKARLSEHSLGQRAELLKEMARALQLLSARMALCNSADGQKPAQQAPLVAPWASREPEDEETRAKGLSPAASGLDDRCSLTGKSLVACAMDTIR